MNPKKIRKFVMEFFQSLIGDIFFPIGKINRYLPAIYIGIEDVLCEQTDSVEVTGYHNMFCVFTNGFSDCFF